MSEQLKGVLTGIKLTHRHRFNSLNLTKPRVSWWFHLSIKTKTHQTKQQKNISLSQFCEWNIDYVTRQTLFRLSFRIDLIKVIHCIVISKVKPKVKRQEVRKKEEHNVLEW